MMKKIYMEKVVASGVLFWEVIVNGSETVCKAGKVGARCNEYPPNQHATPDEANNFFKYLVEQKKKQGFSQVEGTVAKARAVGPTSGALHAKKDNNADSPNVILGARATKRKPLNGTKTDKPVSQKTNFRSPMRSAPAVNRSYSPAPIKRKESPVRAEEEDLPVKRSKSSEKPSAGARKKADAKPELSHPVRRRGRPPKETVKNVTIAKTPKSAGRSGIRKTVTKMVGNSRDEVDFKGVSPIVRARGRPRGKDQTMEVDKSRSKVEDEDDMDAEPLPPLVPKMSTTTTICDKLSKAKIESQQTVQMASVESIKKWKEWRSDDEEEPSTPLPSEKKKVEAVSPGISVREPRKRKMTAKYEIFRQETLGIVSPEREIEEPPKRPTPVKKTSTTAAIRQNLSKTKLSDKPKKAVGRPKKILDAFDMSDDEDEDEDTTEKSRTGPGKAKKTTILKKKPIFKSLGNAKTGRVKSVAQARLTMIKPKGMKTSPLKRDPGAQIEGRKVGIVKPIAGIKRKYSVFNKAKSPVKMLGNASGQVTATPVKSAAITPSKLQLTPSRMSAAPSKLMNPAAKREDSPQPVIKRRRMASSSELTIASEFGTVFKPSVDDWPAFISAPVVWQVPLKKNNEEDCIGQSLLVDPDRCFMADDAGTVIEVNSNAVPKRTWTFPTAVNCMVEHRFRIYAGCSDGVIYEIMNEPKEVARVKDFGKILSMDAFQEYIAVSDEKGNVAVLEKATGTELWKAKSQGEFGWMVCVDESGVFHGHTAGVTKYSLHHGNRMYHLNTDDNVLSGVQYRDFLYVSCGPYVVKIDQLYGTVARTYDKGSQYTGLVHSVAVGGGLVYAGGSKIGCFDEVCGELVYCFDVPYSATAIQYFSGRLFSIGTGMFSVIDFSPNNIEKAMDGEAIDPISIIPVPLPEAPAAITQPQSAGPNTEDKPQPRQGLIKVRQLSMQRR